MRDPIVFLAEPLLDLEFTQAHLVVPLAERLADRFDVEVFAPSIGAAVSSRLARSGVAPLDGGAWFPPTRHARDETPSFIASWIREAVAGLNSRATSRAAHD